PPPPSTVFPYTTLFRSTPKGEEIREDRYGRVSILDTDGKVLARFGGGPPNTPGNFTAPHGIAVDSRGDVYVAEVTWTIGVSAGRSEEHTSELQSRFDLV